MLLSARLRTSVALAAVFAAASMPAGAQTTATTPNDTGSASTTDTATATVSAPAAQEGDIVVVGSRIRRSVVDSASPVLIITRDQTTAAGFNSIGESLQNSTNSGGQGQINNSFGNFVTDGGPGANTFQLRGLGATRTLILLNGRRIAPSGARGSVGSADLNVLPNIIVDNYQILKDGASSIYGSDAVAGVVNIVTTKKLNGGVFELGAGLPNVGAGSTQRASVAYGHTGNRFSFLVSGDYTHRSDFTLGDRGFTSCQTDYVRSVANRTPGSADSIDPVTGQPKCFTISGQGASGITINTIAVSARPAMPALGTPGTVFTRLRPNAAVTTGAVGYEGVNTVTRDTYNQKYLNQSLISPASLYNAYGQASYDLQALGNAEVYFEGLFNRRDSYQIGFPQLSLDYAFGSPLIPAQFKNSLIALPTQITNGQYLGVRAFVGFDNSRSSQRVDFYRFAGGLRGDFFFPGWKYDAFVSSTTTDASYTFQNFVTSRLAQSLDVVPDGNGGFNCRVQTNGCVAAPALTPAVIGGTLPAPWLNYARRNLTGTTKYYENTANFTVDGKLFALPYGNVQAVIGAEYRWDKIDDEPPIESQTGDVYNFSSSTPTRGTDRVMEVFGELEVPLLRNLPFVRELTLNASGRYTDYRSYGSNFTYKFSGIYSPIRAISFRATYGTSFRAPALFEQYVGATSGFLSGSTDPCNQYIADGSSRAINCAKEGLAPTTATTTGFQQFSSVTVLTQGGAASGLQAETSKNFTGGVIFQPKLPKAIGDLRIAVDYYSITVSNEIAQFGGANILSSCYDDPAFRSSASKGYCRFVARDAAGQLTVQNNYINIAQQVVRGIDYTVNYSRDIGQGRLHLEAIVSQYLKQADGLSSDTQLSDYNGTIGSPKWSGGFQADYKIRKVNLHYGFDWVGKTQSYDYLGIDPTTTRFYFETKDYFVHNASVQYKADNWNVTAGVRNFLNTDPPQISYGYYNRIGNSPLTSLYDYVGRTFFLRFGGKF